MSGFGGRGSIPSTNFSHIRYQLVDPRGFRPAESGVQVPHVTKTCRSLNDNLVLIAQPGLERPAFNRVAEGSNPSQDIRDAPKHCSNTLQRAVLD